MDMGDCYMSSDGAFLRDKEGMEMAFSKPAIFSEGRLFNEA